MPALHPSRESQLRRLLQKLGLPATAPVKLALLDQALTHATASATDNYERLEFVGDAVVKLAAAELLYELYPNLPEGELSAFRGIMVSDRTLATIADQYNLERYLLMGAVAHANPVGKDTRLADALEAMIGAFYFSTQDLSLVRPWLDAPFRRIAADIAQDPTRQNYKGALQALTQREYQTLPEYRTKELSQTYGDPQRYRSEVWLMGKHLGTGKGQSIKAAEKAAAFEAYQKLRSPDEQPPAD